MTRFLAAAAASTLLCFMVMGCGEGGPPVGQVKGQVTLDGKPLPNVSVAFVPLKDGNAAMGITDANGNYELNYLDRKGALIGQYKVSVTTVQQAKSSATGEVRSDSPEYAKMIAQSGGEEYNVKFTEPIPAKYNTATELQHEVKSGSQTINLELKSS